MKYEPTFIRAAAMIGVLVGLALAGCSNAGREPEGGTTATAPPVTAPGPDTVVENYLRAASKADGDEMYALIATSERKDETPDSLRKTAADRYSPDITWKVTKTEEKDSTAEVMVKIEGAKVDPNPYRFTLTREAGEWRIVQSPELHETDKDGIKIKL
jgi:hypothetical protein